MSDTVSGPSCGIPFAAAEASGFGNEGDGNSWNANLLTIEISMACCCDALGKPLWMTLTLQPETLEI